MDGKINFITAIFFLFIMISGETALAQAKQTTSKRLLYKLSASAQLTREHWDFSFSKDSCVFNKTKNFKEKDGKLTSVFNIKIELDKVKIEPERKSYDAFFVCKNNKKCVEHTWKDSLGELKESKMKNSASLFIQNRKLADELFTLFKYLNSLCDRSSYSGPAGLKWGEPIESATEKLSQRFKLTKSKAIRNSSIFQQIYNSDFSGFKTKNIFVNFVDGKFYEMSIILDIPQDGSVSQKWYDVVKTVMDKYGNPNKIELPQAIGNLDDIINKRFFDDFKVFDLEINENSWSPTASWTYKNKAVITVNVIPNVKDWEVQWLFTHLELQKLAETRIKENPVDDF